MIKVIFGGLVGGIVVFIWSFVSWDIFPWHQMTMNKFHNEEFVGWVIKENMTKDGVYVIPGFERSQFHVIPKELGKEFEKEKHALQKGPYVYAQIRAKGVDMSNKKHFVIFFLTQIVGAGIISYLLLQAKELRYFQRVLFVTLIGLVIGILTYIPNWNWFGAPFKYFTLVMMAETLIAWFLGGIFIAAIVRTKRRKELMM